jgi:hypothetical protein
MIIVNGELIRICKIMARPYFKMLSKHLPVEAEETQKPL